MSKVGLPASFHQPGKVFEAKRQMLESPGNPPVPGCDLPMRRSSAILQRGPRHAVLPQAFMLKDAAQSQAAQFPLADPRTRAPSAQPPERPSTAPLHQPAAGLPVVNSSTTILDMVRFCTKSNLEANGTAVVLGERPSALSRFKSMLASGDTGTNLKVDSGEAMTGAQRAEAEALGKQAVASMLENTMSEHRLEGTEAGQTIRDMLAGLRELQGGVTMKMVGQIATRVGEAIHAQATAKLGASSAPREAGRMPMECMTHLGSALQQATASASPGQKHYLAMVLGLVKDRVMRHDLTFDSTRTFLARLETDFRQRGLGDLSELTKTLRADLPEAARAENFQTRLHDNIYGRAMESVLMAELVNKPPDNVKTSMAKVGAVLSEVLATQSSESQMASALKMQREVRKDRRGWQSQSPALERFVNADSPETTLTALHAMLRQPKKTGVDCILMPYTAVKLSVCLDSDNAFAKEWMESADAFYETGIHEARSRAKAKSPNPNRETAKAGITMHHQPSIVSGNGLQPAMHPADEFRPIVNTSPQIQAALQHGVAYAGGVSGTTNIMMNMASAFKQHEVDIDAKDVLLGTMMFVNYDGGHSMHEALWVANQVDQDLKLGMGMNKADPKTFVSDYKEFIESFPLEKGGVQLRAAADHAWNRTLAHFRQHSHFAQPADR